MRMEVYRKINMQNSTMMDEYQEKKRRQDRSVLMESADLVARLASQRKVFEQIANEPIQALVASSQASSVWMSGAEVEELKSERAVRNGGYCNVDDDDTFVQQEQADPDLLRHMCNELLVEDNKPRFVRPKPNRSRIEPSSENREMGKKVLLQYRIVDNDSDGDVIEGLGNSTIIQTGNIFNAAAATSIEDLGAKS